MPLPQVGPQLPPDSTGKITAAFPVTVTVAGGAPQQIWVSAAAFVNADGQEIGQALLNAVLEHNELLSRAVTALALIAGELVGANPEELMNVEL